VLSSVDISKKNYLYLKKSLLDLKEKSSRM